MKKLQTREEADALLKRKGEIEIALQQIAGRMNLRIQQAKDAASDAAAPLQQEDAALTAALEAYFQAERARSGGLGRRRSLQLTFGRLGLRLRTAVQLARGWSEARALEALWAAGLQQYVRLRRSINRDAVHQASPEQRERLLRCGLRVESGEKFYCEPDLAALAPGGYEGSRQSAVGSSRQSAVVGSRQ